MKCSKFWFTLNDRQCTFHVVGNITPNRWHHCDRFDLMKMCIFVWFIRYPYLWYILPCAGIFHTLIGGRSLRFIILILNTLMALIDDGVLLNTVIVKHSIECCFRLIEWKNKTITTVTHQIMPCHSTEIYILFDLIPNIWTFWLIEKYKYFIHSGFPRCQHQERKWRRIGGGVGRDR